MVEFPQNPGIDTQGRTFTMHFSSTRCITVGAKKVILRQTLYGKKYVYSDRALGNKNI